MVSVPGTGIYSGPWRERQVGRDSMRPVETVDGAHPLFYGRIRDEDTYPVGEWLCLWVEGTRPSGTTW